MKKNRSRYAVLGRLALGPASGYDIRKYFSETVSHCWKESPGPIYAALRDLEAAGEATSEAVRQRKRPDRYPYTITDAGISTLSAWLSRPADAPSEKNETLLKILSGARVDRAVLIDHIERYRQFHLDRINELSDLEKEADRGPDADDDSFFWLLTIDHGRRQSRAAIDWSEACLSRLKARSTGDRSRTDPPEGFRDDR